MEQDYENEIIKKLDNIQGLKYCKDDILRYARYIKLWKNGKIKNIGNANIMINCDEDYIDRKALVDLLIKIFDTNNVHHLQVRELKNDLFFNKINKDVELFILDAIELQTTLKFNIADLKYRIDSNKGKVFIVINGDFNAKETEYLENNFFWYFAVMKPTVEDMKLYIVNKLKDNGILIPKNCNVISELANEDISVIDSTLVNLIIDIKLKNGDNQTLIDNKILNKYYQNKDTEQEEKNEPNTKSGMEQLDELIGLEPIKQQIKQIVNYVNTAKCRHQPIMLHMALLGNSGCRQK